MDHRRVQSYRSRQTSSKPPGPSCIICFRTQTIFSVGACDHPVCYECSTTMRVLCDQKECPICRRILTKVIFTKEVDLFKNLDSRQYSRYNKKYGIAFDDHSVEHSFEQLMRCYCKKCYDRPDFAAFDQLATHMERTHRLYACRLCVKHLKIFPNQRRWYNHDELTRHEECGDPDNTSHRGHPACHFCDTRYLDKDELYKHLRKEHFYCHFCDADGIQDYYMSYDWLRKHYHDKHYLCEEGNCINEQFTSVFRTAIDLQAHKAQYHSKELGKHGSKEARTLKLEFNLRPRHNSNVEAGRPNQYYQPPESSHSSANMPDRTINVRNTSDFPSLNGQNTTVLPCARTRKQNQPVNTQDLSSFPALGQEPTVPLSKSVQKSSANNSKLAAAAVLKKPAEPSRLDRNKDAVAGSSGVRLPNQARDFPSLDGNQQTTNRVKEAALTSANPASSSWVSKTKTTNENGSQDEKKKNKKEMPAIKKKIAEAPKVPGPSDFPNLNKKLEPSKSNLSKLGNKKKMDNIKKTSGSSVESNNNSSNSNQNVKKNGIVVVPQNINTTENNNNSNNSKKDNSKSVGENNKENNRPKSKLIEQPVPQCNGVDATTKKSASPNNNNKDNIKTVELKKELNKKKESAPVMEKLEENTVVSDTNNPKDKKKRKKNENYGRETVPTVSTTISQQSQRNFSKSESSSMCNTPKIPPGFENNFHHTSAVHRAPPGLTAGNLVDQKAPPGLSRFTENTRTKQFEYIHPVDSTIRNKVLINTLVSSLKPAYDKNFDTFEHFKNMSTRFRKNKITGRSFYLYCEEALYPHNFDTLFLELVSLLPDIQKQQDLLFNYNQNNRRKMDAEICNYCRQVLRTSDVEFHMSAHKNPDLYR